MLTGVTKRQQDAALSNAAFAAPANKLVGPVKGQFGYYVFEVTKITPATQQTLAQATPLIKQQLTSQTQTAAQTAVDNKAKKDWLSQTTCRGAVRDGRLQGLQGAEVGHDRPPAHGDHGVSPPESPATAEALARLDAITRRLRVECPWDREQDERSIVPHTVEESYELADAARRRDDAKMVDELGDVLFQVHFLALLLEERGAGDLAQVAADVTDKLIRRHPHVFGDVEAETSRRGAAELGPDQAARARSRARRVRRGAREPAGAAVRAQGPAPRRHQRVRLPRRRGAAPVGAGRARTSSRPPAPRTSASTSSATCCSRSSTWRANSRSTPSSRCARPPTGSGPACRPGVSSPHQKAIAGTISPLTSSSPTTPERA